jgi:two-component system sensor histidine kinase TctE
LIGLQDELDQRDPNDLQPVTPIQSPSDLQRLARTINGLFQRIAVTGQAQREFAGNVAHELRTPLAGIRSLADYGLRQSDPQAWRQQLERIRQSEQRASHLVQQLLALAQADELRTVASLQVIDVSDLVRDLLLRQMSRAQAQGADLGGEGLDTVHRARVDASLLEGLLTNLVDNALRYGRPADGTVPQVMVSVSALQDKVGITVEDNGPGLAADELEQVLQRARRGKAGDALGVGAGLGLSIAQRYAQLLQATLQFGPGAQGRGLCVRILLPAASA